MALLERQVMACVSRCFGGLRTGDLHALRWESLDTAEGMFRFGWAARKKTARPQLLEIRKRCTKPTFMAVRPSLGSRFSGRR